MSKKSSATWRKDKKKRSVFIQGIIVDINAVVVTMYSSSNIHYPSIFDEILCSG